MQNFYKYLPVSTEDQDWGLQMLHAGYHLYQPGNDYPDKDHPSHHCFDAKEGRVLQEYSLIYITGGQGVYTSPETGDRPVKAGSAIIIFPNERHSYRPDPDTGWTEYWIGFNGPHMHHLVKKKFFGPLMPVINVGYNETMINLFIQVIEAIKNEKAGYQPLVCGAAMYMLGQLHSAAKQQLFITGDEEQLVDHARLIIRSNLYKSFSPQQIADELMISYSRFRKLFKAYTGMAPVQYQIQLKLEKAKEELVNTPKSVKEIAFDLKFESSQYFSNQFKRKTSLTPLEFKRSFGKLSRPPAR
ncbi:AraC family transcriptional regulator [Chitinophaga sp. GbtcB8]|uniref:AraC family transcriptional regulator n=1 Tax=Chitinophaga sp. GbtcB8 TaxID=2824753 RepID=UPI001C2FEB90|nr:AraC family transcriptional regulator [Chitinophaga sp. GbtcB8]